MTVSTTSYSAQTYNGNGATTAFATVFPFLESSHLVVTLIAVGGAETVQTITTHYTVSGGNGSDGTVTMLTAPASGEQLVIERSTTRNQTTDYVENDSFPAATHEKALDKLTFITQEISAGEANVDYPITVVNGGTGATTASDARTNLGLGSIATQASSSVSITGGSISGITDLAVADGGTGASNASDARTNLGLGSIATQASSSVSITGGSITGITDLTVADGGTGASSFTAYSVVCAGTTGTGALQNVSGLGTSGHVLTSNGAGALPTWQAASGGTTITGSPTSNNFVVGNGTDWASTTPANARTAIGLVIGTDVQAYASGLAAISALSVTDGNFIVGNGTTWVVESGATARTSLGLGSIATQDSNNVSITGGAVSGITDLAVADGGTGSSTASGARTNLGLVIGTDVQAYDAELAAIAALAVTDSNFIVGNGTTWVAESGSTVRTSLGLGSIATQDSNNVSITGGSVTGITDIVVADGGTGLSSTTAYAVLCGGTTSTGSLQSVSGVGTTGQVLTSNGSGALPTWQAAGGGGGGGKWEYVSGATASTSAQIDFTGLSSTYIMYQVVITDARSDSDFPDMYIRTSADGSTWDSGASDYIYTGQHTSSGSGSVSSNSTGNTRILIARELGTDTNEYINGTVLIFNPSGSQYSIIQSRLTHHNYAGALWRAEVDGQRSSAAAIQGIRFYIDGANIEAGSFKLYGLKPS